MITSRNIGGVIIGAVLILIGILSLISRVFVNLNIGQLWPLFLIAFGIAFFIIMAGGDKTRGDLAVPGSIFVVLGLILFLMNIIGNWEAWSYSWALIICAVGAGIWINGYWSGQPDLRKRGLDTFRAGLILFIVFGVIMEFIFAAIGQSRWGNTVVWAILLGLVGLYLLASRLLKINKPGSERIDLFWPVLMIGVGAVASFAILGWLPSGNLGMMVNLWPLLLIAAGVGLIFRNRAAWVGFILGLLVVAAIFVVGFAGSQIGLSPEANWFSDFGNLQFGDGPRQVVVGSGKRVTEAREINDVDRVELSINAVMEIQQGSEEKLTVTGDDNILPLLLTSVTGGELAIRYKPQINVRNSTPLKILLTVKDLRELRLSSSGNVEVPSLKTSDFELILSSSCDINIQEIQADEIKTQISSSGDVTIQGKANVLDLEVSSSGSFQAANLQVQKAAVKISSSGDVTLWVVDELIARISSSGDISYYGSPVVRETLTSSGKLIAKGDK